MGLLTDIARKHVYRGREPEDGNDYLLHPYTVMRGRHAGLFELGRTISRTEKRSAHVSYDQLVELFAHECFEQYNIRLRMKDAAGLYPVGAPRVHPQRGDVQTGSDFERAILSADLCRSLSADTRAILRKLGISFAA